jgi:hypothetical protein
MIVEKAGVIAVILILMASLVLPVPIMIGLSALGMLILLVTVIAGSIIGRRKR